MSSPPQTSQPAGPAAGTLPDTGIGKREEQLFSFPGLRKHGRSRRRWWKRQRSHAPSGQGRGGNCWQRAVGRKEKTSNSCENRAAPGYKKLKTQLLSHHPRLRPLGEEGKQLL